MNKRNLPILCAIFLLTAASYWPVLSNQFTNWDDPKMLTENPLVRSLGPSNIKEIFTTTVLKTYVPLTVLSYAVEYRFVGYRPFVYYLDNLLLHLLVTLSVFWFIRKLGAGDRAAGIAALVFGIHPMHVESVAWITERKDVLYAVFYMASLIAYVRYIEGRHRKFLIISLSCAVLSILAKPMALSLPLILALCDWFFKRKDYRSVIWEKIAFCAAVFPFTWITYSMNKVYFRPETGFLETTLLWVWTFVFYIRKFFIPDIFLPTYKMPEPVALSNPAYLTAVVVFCAAIYLLYRFRKERLFVFSCLFFFLSIFFLMRLKKADEIVSFVSDRFIYLPALGFCLLIGWLIEALLRKENIKKFTPVVYGALLLMACFLCVKTYRQAKVWNTTFGLWDYVVRHRPDFHVGWNNRAWAYQFKGEYELALRDFNEALRLKPDYPEALSSRARIYIMAGKLKEAHTDLNRALALNPRLADGYINRGALFSLGQEYTQALLDLDKAVSVDPYSADAYYNRANVYLHMKKYDLALRDFNESLKYKPDQADLYQARGSVYQQLGETEKALQDFNRSIKSDPDFPLAYLSRSFLYRSKKDYPKALEDAYIVKKLGITQIDIDDYIKVLKNEQLKAVH